MEVLVLAPFNEEHMAQIREAAGEGAVVKQMEYDRAKLFDRFKAKLCSFVSAGAE